jgi:hypothetical protein
LRIFNVFTSDLGLSENGGYPQIAILMGNMVIIHWNMRYTIFRQTHLKEWNMGLVASFCSADKLRCRQRCFEFGINPRIYSSAVSCFHFPCGLTLSTSRTRRQRGGAMGWPSPLGLSNRFQGFIVLGFYIIHLHQWLVVLCRV